MSRVYVRRIQGAEGPAPAPTTSDSPDIKEWAERVTKYVPTEIVSAYILALTTIKTFTDSGVANNAANDHLKLSCYIGSFIFGLICTPLYVTKLAKPNAPTHNQLYLSTIAFVIWAYYLGGMFEAIHWYSALVGSLLLVAFTLGAGLIPPE